MKSIFPYIMALFLLLQAGDSFATTSTVNPNIPVQGAPLLSAPMRANFLAAYNDINALWNTISTAIAGGTNGQLQYNNNGALGGYTLAGDCTWANPNITCTKTSGVAFGTLATLNAAPAGTLTGTTLNPTVVASSLTSVGILGKLNIATTITNPDNSHTIFGLYLHESVTGTSSTAGGFNSIVIDSDNAAMGANNVGSAWEILDNFGGALMTGNRSAENIYAHLTAATGNVKDGASYSAAGFEVFADHNDNGTADTLANSSGQFIAVVPIARAGSTATHLYQVGGEEIDVEMDTGSSAAGKTGLAIVQLPGDSVSGSVYDAALTISNSSTSNPGWLNGILLNRNDGTWPMKTNGVFLACVTCGAMNTLIDFTNATFNANAVNLPGFSIDNAGHVGIGSSVPVNALELKSAANNPISLTLNENTVEAWNIGIASASSPLGFDPNNTNISAPVMSLTTGGVLSATSFTGAGTGLTGTASSLTAATATKTAGTLAFGTHLTSGGSSFNGANVTITSDATSANTASTIVARDGSGNFSAGTISAALTGNADTATKLTTARTIAMTGDVTWTSTAFDGSASTSNAGTLATVNSNTGVYGSGTNIPAITVNGKGLITAVATNTLTAGNIQGLGTGVATALGTNVGSAGAFVTFNGAGGTPSSLTGTNISGTAASLTAGNVTTNANMTGDVTSSGNATTLATVNSSVGTFGSATVNHSITVNGKGLITAVATATATPAVGSITGLGTGIATALGVNAGSAGAPVLFNGAGGTPSSLTGTNISGTAASLTAGNVTTNANLTGPITSVGNATTIASGNAYATPTLSGTTTAGLINVTATTGDGVFITTASSSTSLRITDTGGNGANIKLTGDGGTTPNKTIRVSGGNLQFIDSTYSNVIGTLTDAGAFTAKTTLSATLSNTATTSAVCYNTGTGLLTYDGTLGTCTVSDERLKNKISELTDVREKMHQINAWHYVYKDQKKYGKGIQLGLMAQNVQKVFPELVSKDSEGKFSLDYQRLTAPLIVEVNQHDDEIESLKKQVDALKAANDNIGHKCQWPFDFLMCAGD